MKTDAVKSFKVYPRLISTLILCDYITEKCNKKDDGIHTYQIDDLQFKFVLEDHSIHECQIYQNEIPYDYFLKIYAEPRLTNDKI